MNYIKLYPRYMHKNTDSNLKMNDLECSVFCTIFSYAKKYNRATVYGKKFRQQQGYRFSMKIFNFLNAPKRKIRQALANLHSGGHIKRFVVPGDTQCEVSILKPPRVRETQMFYLHWKEWDGGLSTKDNLIKDYASNLVFKYACIDLYKFINCGFWGRDKLLDWDWSLLGMDMQKYLIGGKTYIIPQDAVDELDGTDYNQGLYDAVSVLDPSQVYEINWAIKKQKIKCSPIGILQILNKMGHVKPDTSGGNDGRHVRRRAG